MKKKIFIIIGLILICLIILMLVVFVNKKRSQQNIVKLLTKGENYDNIFIHTKVTDDFGNVINTNYYKKDKYELSRTESENYEVTEWTDLEAKETILINKKDNTAEITKKNKKARYDDPEYSYKFLRYENYNNIKCCVAELTYENLLNGIIWIDVKTGIVLKKDVTINNIRHLYLIDAAIDTVTDEDVNKPDISNYNLIETENTIIDNIPLSNNNVLKNETVDN